MNKLYQVYYIGLLDFLDRIRSKSVMLMILFMMYITYLFVPKNGANIYYTLNFVNNGFFYRGIYNSLWLGWASTVAFISVISLIGFYFVNNSLKRERTLLIGEITASLDIKSWIYIFGKTFGNFLFLLVQVIVSIIITIIMQIIRSESYAIEITNLLLPFIILAVPACLIVAILAITFETIPYIPSCLANISYFFIWIAMLGTSSNSNTNKLFTDIFGIFYGNEVIQEQIKLNFKEMSNISGLLLGNSGIALNNVKTFVMHDISIKPEIFLSRLYWIGISLVLLFLVSLIFNKKLLIKKKPVKKINKRTASLSNTSEYKTSSLILTPLNETHNYINVFPIIIAELKILFNSTPKWLYVCVILISLSMFQTTEVIKSSLLIPLIWILPIFIWSGFASLQRSSDMEDYLFSYRNYRNLQLLCSIIAMFIFTSIINIGVLLSFLTSYNISGILCTFIGIFFVTSLVIFIGNLTGSSTLIEIIYLILWYIGILNNAPYLNFLSTTISTSTITFFTIGAIFLLTAFFIKKIRIKTLYN